MNERFALIKASCVNSTSQRYLLLEKENALLLVELKFLIDVVQSDPLCVLILCLSCRFQLASCVSQGFIW